MHSPVFFVFPFYSFFYFPILSLLLSLPSLCKSSYRVYQHLSTLFFKYLRYVHIFAYSNLAYASSWTLVCIWIGTNLIHDFTAVTFSVKLAFFREKRRFPWNPWFFVKFSAVSLIYDNSRVLSAAFVRMLLFATCRTSALSSWHWLSWVLT